MKGKGIQERIHIHPNIPVPLLSYRACRELALIPEQFPNTITQVTHAAVQSGATERHGKDGNNPHASPPPPPFTCLTTPAQARSYFLKEYADVLLKKEDLQRTPLRPMVGPPMRIHLREDAQPFAIHTPRQIPLAYQETVSQELLSMEAQGIIAPTGDTPSAWCHPLVAVPKPNGGVRITTDLSKLNSQVSRPAHPSPTPFAAI